MTEMQPLAKISPVVLAHTTELSPPEAGPLNSDVRRKVWVGLLILLCFFGVGGGWAALAPLSGAVLAPGVVGPEGQRRIVQHLEGGIIEELLVTEGAKVQQGQPLVVLANVKAQTQVNAASIQLINLAAKEARLKAEATQKKSIDFSYPTLQDKTDPVVRSVLSQEQTHFETRRDMEASRRELLLKRIAQLNEQKAGFKLQLVSTRRQLQLTKDEIVIVAEMVEKGYEKKSRLLNLQAREAEYEGSAGRLISEIGRVNESISENQVQIEAMVILKTEEIEKELSETRAERRKVEELIKDNVDQLSRTRVVAPVAGTVINLRYTTIGGIISPAKPILDIVPEEDALVIEAKVSPKDIDDVRVGQPARVIFPSYPQRNIKRINGVVERVSADTIVDEQNDKQQPYYLARVRVDTAHLKEVAPEISLGPGLPADAFIQTVERTLLEYLLEPVNRTLERAFREK